MSKSGKASKINKNKSKASGMSDSHPTMFTMGYVDLIFKIKLTDKDLEKSSEENDNQEKKNKDDKYYKIEDLNSIKDLDFMKNKKEIWDKIVLSGGNETLKHC